MEYNYLSWTTYYNNNYLTYISNKEGTGWFPKELRQTRLICVIRGACGTNLRIRLRSHWAWVQASVEAKRRRDSLDETPTTELARDANPLV